MIVVFSFPELITIFLKKGCDQNVTKHQFQSNCLKQILYLTVFFIKQFFSPICVCMFIQRAIIPMINR